MPGFNFYGTLIFIVPPDTCIPPDKQVIDNNPPLTIIVLTVDSAGGTPEHFTVNLQADVANPGFPPFTMAEVKPHTPETGFGALGSPPFSALLSIDTVGLNHYVQIDLLIAGKLYSATYFRLPKNVT